MSGQSPIELSRSSVPNGLIVIDKPVGVSSMGVVRRVRGAAARGAGVKRVKCGHAGTLDPLASGVLVCGLGKATRALGAIMADTVKVYDAEVDLSAFTTTDDREGPREEVAVTTPPTREQVDAACQRFVGEIEQAPPAFSAVHVGGKRAYKLARAGELVQLPTRVVRIDAVELTTYDWPIAVITVRCAKGVYIRSLARDLGKALGTGGHLASLRRTAVGGYTLDDARPWSSLDEPITETMLLRIPQ